MMSTQLKESPLINLIKQRSQFKVPGCCCATACFGRLTLQIFQLAHALLRKLFARKADGYHKSTTSVCHFTSTLTQHKRLASATRDPWVPVENTCAALYIGYVTSSAQDLLNSYSSPCISVDRLVLLLAAFADMVLTSGFKSELNKLFPDEPVEERDKIYAQLDKEKLGNWQRLVENHRASTEVEATGRI